MKTPQQGNGGKRKPYKKISDTLRAKIGKYALENGNAAASRKFSKEFDSSLSESTVCSLKKSYTAKVHIVIFIDIIVYLQRILV